MKLINLFALLVLVVFAPACAQDDSGGSGQATLSAGPQARDSLDIAQYVVQATPDGDLDVVLRATNGSRIGEVAIYKEPNGDRVVRVTADGAVTEFDSNTMTIARDGVVLYALDRTTLEAADSASELDATAPQIPAELLHAICLAGIVITDNVFIDHVGTVAPTSVEYVRDCPWWVTAGACATSLIPSPTAPASLAMCVLCGASYFF